MLGLLKILKIKKYEIYIHNSYIINFYGPMYAQTVGVVGQELFTKPCLFAPHKVLMLGVTQHGFDNGSGTISATARFGTSAVFLVLPMAQSKCFR